MFERMCRHENLTNRSEEDAADIAAASRQIVADAISQNPQWLRHVQGTIGLRSLRIAESGEYYHVLGMLTDLAERCSYLFDVPRIVAPLSPGNAAAFICRIPRPLIDGGAAADGPEDRRLAIRSLIEPGAFQREFEALTGPDKNGLLATLIHNRMIEVGYEEEPIVCIRSARPLTQQRKTTAIIAQLPSVTGVVEVFHEVDSGAFSVGKFAALAPGTRPIQDFFFDDRTAQSVRQHLENDLSSRELRPIEEIEWVRNAKRLCGDALTRILIDPQAIPTEFIEMRELRGCRSGEGYTSIVAEAALRRLDNSFVVPAGDKTPGLRSSEPVSLFYSLTPTESPSGERRILYHLSHLALPPCGGVEGVVESMVRAPSRSILTEPLMAILGADLGLDGDESDLLTLSTVIPLEFPEEDQKLELTERNAADERDPVVVLCQHSLGAHVVAINRAGSGLIDISADIIPLHFFPPDRSEV
jgi:hypothetical protein